MGELVKFFDKQKNKLQMVTNAIKEALKIKSNFFSLFANAYNIEGYIRDRILIFVGEKFYPTNLTIFAKPNAGKVIIGKNVLLSKGITFITENHDTSMKKNLSTSEKQGEIVIEDNVWIGTRVIILPKIRIREGAIIGAGSVVTKNIPANEIWAGNPAKFIRKR